MTRLAARSLLALVGLLLPLLLVEVCLRVFGPILPGNYETGVWAQGDPAVGHLHTPNSSAWIKEPEFTTYLRFNARGLRGGPLPPLSDATRVLALGDSFIEAKQVSEEQTVSALLTAGMSGGTSPPVAWLNGGVFDWGPVHEYLFLRHAGPGLAPSLVVQFFYVGNDVDDCFPRSRGELRDLERPVATTDDAGTLELLPWTSRQSGDGERILGWLSRRSSAVRAFETGVVDKVRYARPRRATRRQPVEGRLLDVYRKKEGSDERHAWKTVEALLVATRDEAQQLGARYALVIVPGKWQVHHEDWADLLDERDLPEDDRWDLARPDQRLADIAAAHDIPALDLLPTFRAAANQGTRLYFQRDIHWNAAGHALAADAVARFVEGAELLPR
ncbi:MAG: hypothetical protein IT305_33050 [Chloroflexi bacterium]|nr:hypothetical protein [Chloroflexota bacterium]